jgi:hypothetical protein
MQVANRELDVELAASGEHSQSAAVPMTRKNRLKQSMGISVLFVAFACTRAIHPTVITASKSRLPDGSMGFPYQRGSPICMFPLMVFLGAQLATLAMYGSKGWCSIWEPKTMLIFGINGAIFAFDDLLEMESLSRMHGTPYQVLSQSKILITAILMMPFKGVYQTRMQWMLLISLMFAMSVYMSIQSSGSASGGNVPMMAYLMVLLKVTVSCLGAVYVDKFAKDYAKTVPISAQLVQMYFARLAVITMLVSGSSNVWSEGFFKGWDGLTVAVVVSFCVKGVFTYIVLAKLDAILKNMAECVAVLIVYFYDVLAPWVDAQFNTTSFLGVMVVILVILSYVDAKPMIEKAHKYESEKAKFDALANKVKLDALVGKSPDFVCF